MARTGHQWLLPAWLRAQGQGDGGGFTGHGPRCLCRGEQPCAGCRGGQPLGSGCRGFQSAPQCDGEYAHGTDGSREPQGRFPDPRVRLQRGAVQQAGRGHHGLWQRWHEHGVPGGVPRRHQLFLQQPDHVRQRQAGCRPDAAHRRPDSGLRGCARALIRCVAIACLPGLQGLRPASLRTAQPGSGQQHRHRAATGLPGQTRRPRHGGRILFTAHQHVALQEIRATLCQAG